jgi:DNA polymerase III subunit delta
MHATEIINNPIDEIPGVLALVGAEQSLKAAVIQKVASSVLGEDDTPTRFNGASVEMKAVRDELLTISMWADRRVVVIDDASEFVTDNRPSLEKYAQKPAKKSILVLDVKSMPKNTKLYKIIDKAGLVVDCAELKGAALTKFVQALAKRKHEKTLARDATQLLTELVGNHLGMLEQEVDKLASYVGDLKTIDAETVRRLVGGWKAETTWAMTDAVKAGRIGNALSSLDKLLNGGENAHRIFGGITYVFRKLAVATEYARQGVNLPAAIKKAGAFPHEVDAANGYLRRIGFAKAEQIASWLLEVDTGLKGGSKLPERCQLELLLVKLAGQV